MRARSGVRVRLGSYRNDNYGPSYNPLDIHLPIHQDGDRPSEWLAGKLRYKIQNGQMRRYRSVPVARRAWFVTLTIAHADPSHFAPRSLVTNADFEPQRFWVHARRVAQTWVARDQQAGGSGSAFACEFRLCPVCGRTLLAVDATNYRQRQRRSKKSWTYPQGPACSVDCKPPAIIRNSKNRSKPN